MFPVGIFNQTLTVGTCHGMSLQSSENIFKNQYNIMLHTAAGFKHARFIGKKHSSIVNKQR